MKTVLKISLIILTMSVSLNAQIVQEKNLKSDSLIGIWKIDLRPMPKSEPYFQFFEVIEIEDKKLKGSFYGSDIKEGLINTEWRKLYFSFTTSDQSNDYYHSGYLLDGKLYGISYCPNRAFTAPWTGILKDK